MIRPLLIVLTLAATCLAVLAGPGPARADVGDIILNPSILPQWVKSYTVEPHGHFAIVNFDLRHAVTKARVELWENGTVHLQTKTASVAKTFWQIQVDYLSPGTAYVLKIYAPDPLWGGTMMYPKVGAPLINVTTLKRNVTVTYRWVRVHDDSDPNSCGEMVFGIALAGGTSTGIGAGADGWVDICDGEAWDPADGSVGAQNTGDAVTVSLYGVDDDEAFGCATPYPGVSYGSAKNCGEWSEESFAFDVSAKDFTLAGEQHSYYANYYVADGGGDPKFTWYLKVDVSYA